jgi:hypothetical protein
MQIRMDFWDYIMATITVISEMCPVHHPLGHQSLFSWDASALPGTSFLEWGIIVSVVAGCIVYFKKR